MKSSVLAGFCLVVATSFCAAAEPALDTAGVKTVALLDGFESRPELKTWVEFWATNIPGLTLDSFQIAYSGGFYPDTLDYANPPSPSFPTFDQRIPTLVFSPDSSMAVDPLPYDLYFDGDSLVIGREPDSFMYLIDVRTKIGVRVFQCGTPCYSQHISWVDLDRVALVGMNETGSTGGELRPVIYLINLRTRAWTLFHGPQVDRLRKLEYSKAWGACQDRERSPRD